MGAQTSKPEAASATPRLQSSPTQSLLDKVTPDTPSTSSTSPSDSEPPPSTKPSKPSDYLNASRQSHLDSSVRSAISAELTRLRKQEAEVTAQIQSKLEAENLAIEEKHSSKGKGSGAGRSSDSLRKELEEVKRKIERHDSGRKQVESSPGVKEARKAVLECYKEKGTSRTLDCWKEVKDFTEAVEKAERNFISSLTE